ncbi:glycosyltransferase [Thalassobius vesicularis]|uniref:Glycosyltransferase n=1 Tax=Thalassobius vesicularis TaxID=1294297 RepID=A0A4V3UZ37_9RHOB|nr:glycosyltransferase family 4 protein [Thalassobius vesicularis]THD74752.1 glycosyltransferase [Thalassobius vesicularis]
MHRPTIVHLIDDTNAGGVMRLLEHICADPEMNRTAQHIMRPVKRGALSMRRIQADVIVSHLSISWRTLPSLISLRAVHPGTPLIHVEHSYTQSFTALNVPNRERFFSLLRIGYSLFDHQVAVSHAQARWMFRRRLVDLGKLTVIPPMVGLERFAALPAPAASTPRRIGAIGRHDRQKGFDLLISAFRAVKDPNAELMFFGEGPETEQLKHLAAGDRRITFAGHAADPVAAMASVDALAMPSRWEAYGLVALEGRMAGRPVLVSPQDGLKDQVAAGAIPVQSFTVEAWTEALTALLQGDIAVPARPDPAELERDFAQNWQQMLHAVLTSDDTQLAA